MWNLDHNEKISYGKNLEFIHAEEAFAEGYKGVLSFIRNWVEDHYGAYMSRYESHLHMNDKVKVRDLSLNGKELEELFLSLGDGAFKMQMNQDPEITWQTVKAVPERTLVIRRKEQGLSLELVPVYSVTGVRYHICILMEQRYIWCPERSWVLWRSLSPVWSGFRQAGPLLTNRMCLLSCGRCFLPWKIFFSLRSQGFSGRNGSCML